MVQFREIKQLISNIGKQTQKNARGKRKIILPY